MRQKNLLIFCIAIGVATFTAPVFADDGCPSDPRKALIEARADLTSSDDTRREQGIVCLLTAVEAVQAQLDDLVAGKITFEGPVVAPEFLYSGEKTKERSQ